MHAGFRSPALLAIGVLSCAPPLLGQATATADLNLSSTYVWRGVNFTNRPVVQGDAFLTLPVVGGQLVGGIWGNAEPADYRGADVLRMVAAGHSGPAVTAVAPWADFTHATRRIAATVGATRYLYPALTGLSAQFNTTEVYAKAGLAVPLAPHLAIWYDVEKVRGAYVEGSLTHALSLGGQRSLSFSGTAGVTAGQSARADESSYFVHDGLALVDLGATAALPLGPVSLAPTLHVIFAHDDATRVTAPDGTRRSLKAWIGATATVSHALSRAQK